ADAPLSALGQALTRAVRYAAESQFDAVLGEAISKRDLLDALVRGDRGTSPSGSFDVAETALRSALSIRRNATPKTVAAEMETILS
ncbi:hypothetical protein, partial [Staphylococcus aureus]